MSTTDDSDQILKEAEGNPSQEEKTDDSPTTTTTATNSEQDVAPSPPSASVKQCCMCPCDSAMYTCPGCQRRTCSVLCVRAHKIEYHCSGTRDVAAPVPLGEFNDSQFTRDFHFLEDCHRVVTRAEKELVETVGPARPFTRTFHPSTAVAALRDAARRRGVLCQIMSEGMAKRKANTSRYDAATDTLIWRCEFRFFGQKTLQSSRETPSFVCSTEWGNERFLLGDILQHCHQQQVCPTLPCYKIQRGYNTAQSWVQSSDDGSVSAPLAQPLDVVDREPDRIRALDDGVAGEGDMSEPRILTTTEAVLQEKVQSFLRSHPQYCVRYQAERLGDQALYFDLSPADTLHAALRKIFFVNEFPVFLVIPLEHSALFPIIDEASKERIRESFRKRSREHETSASSWGATGGGGGGGPPRPLSSSSFNSGTMKNAADGNGGAKPFPCRQYLNTKQCSRGSTCPYLHCDPDSVPPCRFALKNLPCPHGMKCCFRH